jgi:Kef-type K+ transport system membrane component KefB
LGFVVAVHVVGLALIPSLFVATALTATSVGVSVAVWRDAGALRSDNGALMLDVAEMDDISAVVLMAMLLAVAPALASGDGAALASAVGATAGLLLTKLAGFGAFCVAFSRYAERPLTELFARLEHRPAPMLMVAGTGFIIAAIAGWLGFSLALGALFAGLVFSVDPRALNIDVSFGSLYEFFMPFFFIGIGLKVDPASLGAGAQIAAALLAVAVLGKVVGAGGPALISTGWQGATLIGISMVPRAEIALVVMHQGLALGDWAVSGEVFGAMVIVSIATCVLAPLALKPLLQHWPQADQG